MPFREKTAWITLIAILIVSALFWFHAHEAFGEHANIHVLHAMGASLAAYILIEIIGRIVLRLRNPLDARLPPDEREQLIALKAMCVAYYALIVGVLSGIFFPLHVFGTGSGMAVWLVFLAVIVAQAVKQAALIYYYRRGT